MSTNNPPAIANPIDLNDRCISIRQVQGGNRSDPIAASGSSGCVAYVERSRSSSTARHGGIAPLIFECESIVEYRRDTGQPRLADADALGV